MKCAEVNFQTVLNAAKHHWKIFFLTVLFLSAVGVCSGYFYSSRLSAPADGGAEGTMLSDFSELTFDRSYYLSCKKNLVAAYDNGLSYLEALSSEQTATQSQKEQLAAYKVQLGEFGEKTLQPIRSIFDSQGYLHDIHVPSQLMEKTTEEYKTLLENTRLNLSASETAVDMIKNMDAPNIQTDNINAAYEKILTLAAQYGDLKENETIYEHTLEQLTQEPEKVIARSQKLERDLKTASRQLNEILEEINQTAHEMAKENHFNLSVAYGDSDVIQVTIKHTHGTSDSQENFLLITLFCVLVGICSGVFFAVCKEAFDGKKQKRKKT